MASFLAGVQQFSREAERPRNFLRRCAELTPNPYTWRARQSDWRDFMAGELSDVALQLLFDLPHELVRALLDEYEQEMKQRDLKSTTCNRRLNSLRNLFRIAESEGWQTGKISGFIEPKAATTRPRPALKARDVERLLALPTEGELRGARDAVILRLMIENSLSRTQICTLNVGDCLVKEEIASEEVASREVTARATVVHLQVLPLRRRQTLARHLQQRHNDEDEAARNRNPRVENVPLSAECSRKLCKYLQMLKEQGGAVDAASPLFRALDRRQESNPLRDQRLTPDGVYDIVARYAKRLGVALSSRALQGFRAPPMERMAHDET